MEDNKYQQGKIYKIVCNITNEIYIGSTIEERLNDRLSLHKNLKDCVCRQIIERGDYKIELIKDYPCNNVWELEEEEGKYIRENKCINKQIPHRTKKEYREDNKEKIALQMKKYYEEHIKEIKQQKKEKITCECGALVSIGNLPRHKRTSMKHIKKMQCIIID